MKGPTDVDLKCGQAWRPSLRHWLSYTSAKSTERPSPAQTADRELACLIEITLMPAIRSQYLYCHITYSAIIVTSNVLYQTIITVSEYFTRPDAN